MFKPVAEILNITLVEEEILRFWKSHRIFERTINQHSKSERLSFVDQPNLADRHPGWNDFAAWVLNDVQPRYKTMLGKKVQRWGAWDAHGLTLEKTVEQRLQLPARKLAEEQGMAYFVDQCRKESMDGIFTWMQALERWAVWANPENHLLTSDQDSIERIWSVLHNFWERGLLYEDYQVAPYCPHCATTISFDEANRGKRETSRPGAFVRFPLVEDPQTSLLVWTDRPWILPACTAVAVNPGDVYVIVERDLAEGGVERLILAQDLVESVFARETQAGQPPVRVFEAFSGEKLRGLQYQPLFTFTPTDNHANIVLAVEFVENTLGTGLIPLAPAYGAIDLKTAGENNLPVVICTNEDGSFLPLVRPWRGRFVLEAEPMILDDLQRRGLVYAVENMSVAEPHCLTCGSVLLNTVHSAWYIRSRQFQADAIEKAGLITWQPGEAGLNFQNMLASFDHDWLISRSRFWGVPLPIWECLGCHAQVCIESAGRLSELAGRDLNASDLHRPVIDTIKFSCGTCGGMMQRVGEVLDHEFEAVSILLADQSAKNDGLAAAAPDHSGVARNYGSHWLMQRHQLSVMLNNQPAVRRALELNLFAGDDQPAHGNIGASQLSNLIHEFGVDTLRWLIYRSDLPSQHQLTGEAAGRVFEQFITPLWQAYALFVGQANDQGWMPDMLDESAKFASHERQVLTALADMLVDAGRSYEQNQPAQVCRAAEKFVFEVLPGLDLARNQGVLPPTTLKVLYTSLTVLSKILAPLTPFLAEEIHQNLVVFVSQTLENPGQDVPVCIQLAGWPEVDPAWTEPLAVEDLPIKQPAINPGKGKARGIRKN